MSKEQLHNIINFCFILFPEDSFIHAPSYICEKWESLISMNDDDLILHRRSELSLSTALPTAFNRYEYKWGF